MGVIILSKTFKQYDSRWGKKNYNGSSTMAAAGCGPTSVAMIAYNMNTKINPWTVAQYMKKHGYAIRNAGTAWAGIPAALKYYGCQQVKANTSMSDVWNHMKKGNGYGYAVFLFRGGSRGGVKWTGSGHYVAVTDYKVKNGKHWLYTRDSYGPHTGWYCYEDHMKGLIKQTWTCYVPKLNGVERKKAAASKTTTKSNGQKIIEYAASQAGSYASRSNHGKDGKQYTNKFIKYFEGKAGIKNGHLPNAYGYIPGYCTAFVCYCLAHNNVTSFLSLNTKKSGYFWHAPGLWKWCKSKGYNISVSNLKPGDICFKGKKSPTHSCLFLKTEGDYIWTWDGNVGGGVTKNKRKKSAFCGFARIPEDK